MSIPAPKPNSAAFVTGASSGIGRAFAEELAGRGHNLVLVARRRARLETLAADLRTRHGIRADILACDLSDPLDRARMLVDLGALDYQLDALILCAGFGMVGPYLDHDVDRLITMVRTNVEATVALTRELAPPMVSRGHGAILLVSSMAGNQPMPYFAPYAATKAAITSLGEALHSELKPAGITVTVLAPANVDTEFAETANASRQTNRQPAFLTATAEECARAGMKALQDGRRQLVPLPQAAAFAWLAAHLPRRIWFRACRTMLR
ncbi:MULTISPECIES: SDR family NAD(P)-dependent oxidoreductase [Mycobacterium]|uniref:Short-chain dehydrogenase n=1 Tax=Mycobacterium kiyosense TaxID=2871094 RepID=A0A9P3Q3S8_9MYCO|nr:MULTISPECIES: SDR family oxidoreductase [Mycobacterium]BDB44250.1 short-chain dehydrogenase [Mycobacterium kiyosense]BDE15785.1 short-chain dehydrogenase [Mycobacterium sp. 20KCMC460]GLB80821.1 short-chain dehydrogenase [Mycobacterium kiyosense]GLB87441.1 short-chain dehydrogenase [Mycobacterium kiyosense]GLB93301.1 short-chain dehydrogenase [Mycobacterium kiyosense]